MSAEQSAAATVSATFAAVDLEGCLHALDIDGTAELSYRGDQVCESASIGKLPIIVALMRAAAEDAVALDERIAIPAGGRTPGMTGFSQLTHRAEISLADLAQLMIAVSDNHATDVVLSRVRPDQVTAAMRDLGLASPLWSRPSVSRTSGWPPPPRCRAEPGARGGGVADHASGDVPPAPRRMA